MNARPRHPNAVCTSLLIVMSSPLLISQNLQVNTPADLSSRNRDAINVTRDQVRTDRKALVAKSMNLTDSEAQAFWPVYDRYSDELAEISDRTINLVTEFADNYHNLGDSDAQRLTQESLAIEQKRLAVRQAFVPRFAAVLPGKKVARFFQIERRLDAVTVLNVTQAVSLVE